MKNKILLMLPAYNEEDTLPQLLKRIVKTFNNFNLNGEILVVNDGSKDKTLEIAQNFKSDYPIHIHDIQPNKGLSNAMREGFNKSLNLLSEDDVLIVMDADDSHNPGLIPLMLQKNAEGAEIVIASRYREGSRIKGLNSFRKFLSWGAGMLYRIFIRIKGVRDYTCGYRAYNPSLLNKALNDYKDKFIEEQGFAGMAEILLKLKKYKPVIIEVPFILRYDRKESESKMNVGNTVKQSLKLIAKFTFKMSLLKKLQNIISKNPTIFFLMILLSTVYYYNYHKIMQKPIQSTHMWRQADCASFALNYYQDGMHFFHPETHNLSSDENTSGAGISEAPILYYSVATLYKIFGYNDKIYRIFNTLIFLLGFIFLFKFLYQYVLKDFFSSAAIPLLLFASPVVSYYGSSFMTDATALSLTLIAWYYFFKFKNTKKDNAFYISIIFFTLAGLLKILSLVSFITILTVYLTELLNLYKFNNKEKIFQKGIKQIFPFLFLIIIIISWYLFAIRYNKIHNTTYFANRILPIWEFSAEQITDIVKYIYKIHFREYYHGSFFYITIILFIINIIWIKRSDKFLSGITFLLFAGSIFIIILWFKAFRNHDYYFLSIILFPIFNLITFINNLKTLKLNKSVRIISGFLFAGYLLFMIHDAEFRLGMRYSGWKNERFFDKKNFTEIKPYLNKIGIFNDTVVSIGDKTYGYTLYMMNLKGWTQMDNKNLTTKEINEKIKKGAKYLIINHKKNLKEDFLKPFLHTKAGEFKDIYIYKVK